MTKQETTLCFIMYVGNCGGTAMKKAIKEFAHKEYEGYDCRKTETA